MNSNMLVGVVIVVFIAVFIFLVLRSVNKDLKKEDEKRKEFERIKDDLKKVLSGKKLVVVIRTGDGRQTDFESVIIEKLISLGVKIFSVSSEAHKDIWSGKLELAPDNEFVLVGIMKTSAYEADQVDKHIVDMRVVVGKTKQILGACTVQSLRYDLLSNMASSELSKIIQRQS